MNGAKAVSRYTIGGAAARGACPVCTVLRHRQTHLIEETGIPRAKHLCNHHAWALAKSAPASIAADILLETLRARHAEIGAASTRCDFCEELTQEEASQMKQLAGRMHTPSFLEWMRRHGTLCLHHAGRICEQLSPDGRKVIAELLSRTFEELEQDLAGYAKHASRGLHAGGGVLGRAAEFLMCQRGIVGDEETPC